MDRIIVMNSTESGGCEVIDQGSLQELYQRGYDLSKLVNQEDDSKYSTTEVITPTFESLSNVSSAFTTTTSDASLDETLHQEVDSQVAEQADSYVDSQIDTRAETIIPISVGVGISAVDDTTCVEGNLAMGMGHCLVDDDEITTSGDLSTSNDDSTVEESVESTANRSVDSPSRRESISLFGSTTAAGSSPDSIDDSVDSTVTTAPVTPTSTVQAGL